MDSFLELNLTASSFLKVGEEYSCIHDDNDGNTDQCLKIVLKKDASNNEVFHLHTPTSPGLRFRNHAGGGMSLQVHNALKILIYASFKNEAFLPGLERTNTRKYQVVRNIEEILQGIIVLPPEIFASKKNLPNYFFEIAPRLTLAIAVDGDTHIITELATVLEKQIRGETTFWNPESFIFSLHTNCSRAMYNALILLAIATKQSNR